MPIRFGGIPLRHSMTVIRLNDGGLFIHSPTKLDEATRSEIDRLGPVNAIVAPSWWHDLFLPDYVRAYPRAALFGAPALVRWNRALPFEILGSRPPVAWETEIDQVQMEGGGLCLDEVVFYHRDSRTLIVADLLFNVSKRDARITRMLSTIVIGSYPGCRFPRLYRPAVRDRNRLRASIARLLEWDFTRIIVGHGDVVENDGKEIFRAAFRWLLDYGSSTPSRESISR